MYIVTPKNKIKGIRGIIIIAIHSNVISPIVLSSASKNNTIIESMTAMIQTIKIVYIYKYYLIRKNFLILSLCFAQKSSNNVKQYTIRSKRPIGGTTKHTKTILLLLLSITSIDSKNITIVKANSIYTPTPIISHPSKLITNLLLVKLKVKLQNYFCWQGGIRTHDGVLLTGLTARTVRPLRQPTNIM